MGRRRRVWLSITLRILWEAFSLAGSGSALAVGYEPLPRNDGYREMNYAKVKFGSMAHIMGDPCRGSISFYSPVLFRLNFAGMSNS